MPVRLGAPEDYEYREYVRKVAGGKDVGKTREQWIDWDSEKEKYKDSDRERAKREADYKVLLPKIKQLQAYIASGSTTTTPAPQYSYEVIYNDTVDAMEVTYEHPYSEIRGAEQVSYTGRNIGGSPLFGQEGTTLLLRPGETSTKKFYFLDYEHATCVQLMDFRNIELYNLQEKLTIDYPIPHVKVCKKIRSASRDGEYVHMRVSDIIGRNESGGTAGKWPVRVPLYADSVAKAAWEGARTSTTDYWFVADPIREMRGSTQNERAIEKLFKAGEHNNIGNYRPDFVPKGFKLSQIVKVVKDNYKIPVHRGKYEKPLYMEDGMSAAEAANDPFLARQVWAAYAPHWSRVKVLVASLTYWTCFLLVLIFFTKHPRFSKPVQELQEPLMSNNMDGISQRPRTMLSP